MNFYSNAIATAYTVSWATSGQQHPFIEAFRPNVYVANGIATVSSYLLLVLFYCLFPNLTNLVYRLSIQTTITTTKSALLAPIAIFLSTSL
jgi:hypothetical protein